MLMEFFVSFLVWLFGLSPNQPPPPPEVSPPQVYVSPLDDDYNARERAYVQKSQTSNIIIVVEDTHFKPLRKEVKE